MAKLKRVVDKIEEVAEKFRDLYTEKNGKFYLDAEDNDEMLEVRQALDKERSKNTELAKQIKRWEKAGKTPEEIMQLLEGNADMDEAIVRERAKIQADHEKQLAQVNKKHEDALNKKDQRVSKLTSKMHDLIVTGPASQAIAKHKGVANLLMPHVRSRVKVVEDGEDFQVRVVDAKGEPRVNDKGEFLTLDDLVGEMRGMDDFGRAFEGTTAGGSGTRPNGGNGAGGAKTMKRVAFSQLPPIEQATTVKSGVQIVD